MAMWSECECYICRLLQLDNCFALRHAVVASDCLEDLSLNGCKGLLSLQVTQTF